MKTAGNDIATLLGGLYQSRKSAFVWTGILSFASLCLFLIATLAIAEHVFYLDFRIKTVFLVLIPATTLFLAYRFFSVPSLDFRAFVKQLSIELHDDSLIRYSDLLAAPESSFKQAAINQLSENLDKSRVENLLGASRLLQQTFFRLKLSAGFAGFTIVLLAVTMAGFLDAYQRISRFWDTYYPPNPFQFAVTPGNQLLELGAPFDATVTFSGRPPRKTWLEIRSGGAWRRIPVTKENDSVFAAKGLVLNDRFSYRFKMDSYISGEFDVHVEMLPRWESLSIEIAPPAYTKAPAAAHVYPVSQFEVLKGSRITLRAKANKPLSSALLETGIHKPVMDAQATDSMTFRFTLLENDTLSFHLVDGLGLRNKNRFALAFSAVEDQFPTVAMLQPEPETEKAVPETVPLVFVAQDDFGLRSIKLFTELKKEVLNKTISRVFPLASPENKSVLSGEHPLNLEALGMESLDVLSYWLEAEDNDAVGGFKKTRTPVFKIRIAGLSDLLLALDEDAENVESGLENASGELQSVEDEFKRLKESLQKQERRGWQEQQNIQKMEENLNRVQEQLNKTKEEFEKLNSEMQTSQVLSEETKRQFEELQQLMQEIDDPALLKLLEEMEKGLQNIDQNQLRQALEQFEFDEERYRERLERTMELFKTLQTMAELDKLDRRLQEMEAREQQLENAGNDPQIQQKTGALQKQDAESFKKAASELNRKAPEKMMEKIDDLAKELDQDAAGLQEEMENAESPQESGSRQSREKIKNQLKQMRKKLADAKSSMSQKSLQINIAALKTALTDLIFLSELEETVINDVSELDFRSDGFTIQARRQNVLQSQFYRISDSLAAVSKEISQFSNKILEKKSDVSRRMEVSLKYLSERDKSNASSDIRFAMGGINELASMLADLIKQLEDQQQQGGEGGSGGMSSEQLMESLKNMSGQQQKLNQQMQDLINDVAGNRLSQSQQDRLEQMARQQNEIRKKLKDIQQQSGLEPGDKILSELERLAQHMEESINEMRGGNTDRIMINRQQNILSRMLEVEKSLDQREEDEKRKGDRPKELPPAERPQMTLEELKKIIQQRLSNPDQTRYSPEFQELIRLYFEMIES